MALVSQRILPLPKVISEAIIAKYCSRELQAHTMDLRTTRYCLARLYMGRRRTTKSPLQNFNLHLDQTLEVDLPVDSIATAMGKHLV